MMSYTIYIEIEIITWSSTNYNGQFDVRYQDKDNENVKLYFDIKPFKEKL